MKLLTSGKECIVPKQKTKQNWLFMRITMVMLLVNCLHAGAKSFSQNVTLSVKDAPLLAVISEIRKQTGYDFLFKSSWMDNAKPVTISVTNSPITAVLSIVFKDQPLTYQLIEKSVIIKLKEDTKSSSPFNPSPIDVKGRVINEKGEAVAGVTVTIKGSKIITSTNSSGEFELSSVDRNAILTFTSVNMESFELKVSGQTELIVNLKTKVASLGDVTVTVNTGYQNLPKERATGAFSYIDNKTINQQTGVNILKRLEGITTSVLFDTKPLSDQKQSNITVRGLSSINGPLDPLIVVDGFIYEGSIANINPNIVENITILKDAAAASIWGARAGNGVIVITTKKGQLNQKLQIDFNSTFVVSSKPDLFYLPYMASSDYIDVEQYLYNQGLYDDQFSDISHPPLSPAIEIFQRTKNGLLTSHDSAIQINALKSRDVRNDYNKYFYTNPTIQQYSIGLKGGTSNNASALYIAYDKTLSETYDKSNKLNIKIENSYRPVNNLEATVSLYYTTDRQTSGRPAYNNITIGSKQVPYLQFAEENGTPLAISTSLRDAYTDTVGGGKLLNWKYYPIEDYKHNTTKLDRQEFYAIAGLQYKFPKFLAVSLRYQYQSQNIKSELLQDVNSFAARDLINRYTNFNETTPSLRNPIAIGGIKSVDENTVQSHTARAQLNINHAWKIHELTGIIGGEIRQVKGSGNSYRFYGYNEDPLSFANTDFVNQYPLYLEGTGSATIPGAQIPKSENTNRFVSAFTNFAYTLDQKYILSVSARRDGSNIFGANTNDKWKPLWSMGLSWNISKEAFYNSNLIPLLRLRATYGKSGNVDLRKTGLPVAVYTFNSLNTNFTRASISALNNPDLRWEQVRTLNIGVDFSFKKNIITGSVDYYRKNSNDLYGPTPYDYTAYGNSATITKNVADMEGNGIEVMLNSLNVNKEIKWSSSILFTYQRNETSKYYTKEAASITQLLGGGDRITPVVGKPLYSIAAYKWGGLDASGNPQGFANGEKSIDYTAIVNEGSIKGVDGNIVYVGSTVPTTFGSFINTFSWRNLSLAVNITYKLGYFFRRPSLSYVDLINGKGHPDYSTRWKNPGDELKTNVPSFNYPNDDLRDAFYTLSEINVLKGDHIRLHYISFAYSLYKHILNKLPFKELQFYVNASNLGILWRSNKEKLDPDYPSILPPSKSFAFGIRSTF